MAKGNTPIGNKGSKAISVEDAISNVDAVINKRVQEKKDYEASIKSKQKELTELRKQYRVMKAGGVLINYKMDDDIYRLKNEIQRDKNEMHWYDEAIDYAKQYKAAVQSSNFKSFSERDFSDDMENFLSGYESDFFKIKRKK